MKISARLLLAGAALLLTGCWDFNGAYNHYCSAVGCNDAGPGGGSGGGGGGSSTGGGSGGGGGSSVGGGSATGGGGGGTGVGGGGGGSNHDGGCLGFGEVCSGVDDCCPTVDGGFYSFYQGFKMGCSKLNFCQLVPPAATDGGFCMPRGYGCHDSTECCDGTCNAGRCSTCGNKGDICSSIYDCCYDEYYVGCDLNTGRCVSTDRADAGNACTSSDMCADDDTFDNYPSYCFLDGGSPGSQGVCEESHGTCINPGNPPSGGHTCCPGLMQGTDNKCCLPPGEWCSDQASSCCAGSFCQSGKCVPTGTPDPDLDGHCLYFQSCGGTGSGYWCDPISETCGRTFCFPSASGSTEKGCCKWSDQFGVCTFADNSTCKMFDNPCTTGAECCGGNCVQFSDNNFYCDYPSYY